MSFLRNPIIHVRINFDFRQKLKPGDDWITEYTDRFSLCSFLAMQIDICNLFYLS